MPAFRWPWQKKKKENEVTVVEDKKSSGLNLRNPDQKRAEEDPLGEAMVSIANESMDSPIEECPAIFMVCDCGKTHFRQSCSKTR